MSTVTVQRNHGELHFEFDTAAWEYYSEDKCVGRGYLTEEVNGEHFEVGMFEVTCTRNGDEWSLFMPWFVFGTDILTTATSHTQAEPCTEEFEYEIVDPYGEDGFGHCIMLAEPEKDPRDYYDWPILSVGDLEEISDDWSDYSDYVWDPDDFIHRVIFECVYGDYGWEVKGGSAGSASSLRSNYPTLQMAVDSYNQWVENPDRGNSSYHWVM